MTFVDSTPWSPPEQGFVDEAGVLLGPIDQLKWAPPWVFASGGAPHVSPGLIGSRWLLDLEDFDGESIRVLIAGEVE